MPSRADSNDDDCAINMRDTATSFAQGHLNVPG
jgi:hypothetical protein